MTIRLWGFSGIHDSDYLIYNESAHRLRMGEYVNPSPWSLRYMLIIPLAISQAIFGVNEYASAVPPMLYSLACLILVYLIAKTYADQTVGLIAAGLWALFPLDIIQATELHVDLLMTTFLSLSVYALIRGERSAGRKKTALFMMSGVALGLAYLAKEVALVLVVFLAARVAWQRTWHVGYIWIAIGSTLVEVLELVWFGFMTGSPLYRFSDNIWRGHFQTIAEWSDPPFKWMLDYADLLINPLSTHAVYLGGFFLPVLAGSIWGWRARDRVVGELSLWWMTTLVVFNFIPRDLTFRDPLFHHFARTLHPIFVPGLVIAAYVLIRGVTRPLPRLLTLACLMLLTLVSVGVLRLDYRLYAETARQAYRIAQSLPNEAMFITDPVNRGLLRFYSQYRRTVIGFEETDIEHATGPTLWLYDPSWIAYAGLPDPPSCPVLEIKLQVMPSVMRDIIARLTAILPGAERVRRRWERDSAKLFVCFPTAKGQNLNR